MKYEEMLKTARRIKYDVGPFSYENIDRWYADVQRHPDFVRLSRIEQVEILPMLRESLAGIRRKIKGVKAVKFRTNPHFVVDSQNRIMRIFKGHPIDTYDRASDYFDQTPEAKGVYFAHPSDMKGTKTGDEMGPYWLDFAASKSVSRNPAEGGMGTGTSVVLGAGTGALLGFPGIGIGSLITWLSGSKKTMPFLLSGLATTGLIAVVKLAMALKKKE